MKKLGPEGRDFEVVDGSNLTDADWAAINQLRRAYSAGDVPFANALEDLAKDPIRYMTVIGALFPAMAREMIRDGLTNRRATEDVRRLLRKPERSPGDQ